VARENPRLSLDGSRKIVQELAERASEHLGWEVSVSKARGWSTARGT
jgi:hypothetical protein